VINKKGLSPHEEKLIALAQRRSAATSAGVWDSTVRSLAHRSPPTKNLGQRHTTPTVPQCHRRPVSSLTQTHRPTSPTRRREQKPSMVPTSSGWTKSGSARPCSVQRSTHSFTADDADSRGPWPLSQTPTCALKQRREQTLVSSALRSTRPASPRPCPPAHHDPRTAIQSVLGWSSASSSPCSHSSILAGPPFGRRHDAPWHLASGLRRRIVIDHEPEQTRYRSPHASLLARRPLSPRAPSAPPPPTESPPTAISSRAARLGPQPIMNDESAAIQRSAPRPEGSFHPLLDLPQRAHERALSGAPAPPRGHNTMELDKTTMQGHGRTDQSAAPQLISMHDHKFPTQRSN